MRPEASAVGPAFSDNSAVGGSSPRWARAASTIATSSSTPRPTRWAREITAWGVFEPQAEKRTSASAASIEPFSRSNIGWNTSEKSRAVTICSTHARAASSSAGSGCSAPVLRASLARREVTREKSRAAPTTALTNSARPASSTTSRGVKASGRRERASRTPSGPSGRISGTLTIEPVSSPGVASRSRRRSLWLEQDGPALTQGPAAQVVLERDLGPHLLGGRARGAHVAQRAVLDQQPHEHLVGAIQRRERLVDHALHQRERVNGSPDRSV